MEISIKASEVVSVEKHSKSISGWHFYGKAFGIFGKPSIRIGNFSMNWESIVPEYMIEKLGLYVEDSEVYLAPHIIFNLSDGSSHTKIFKNIDDMEKYMLRFSGYNWVVIND